MAMSDYLSNQLHFRSNSESILRHLKSKASSESSAPLFSLNSIRKMPTQLELPLRPFLVDLCQMNMEMPGFKDNAKKAALEKIFLGKVNKKSDKDLLTFIESQNETLEGNDLEILEQAFENFEQLNFFGTYDWRMAHWGTVEDIHSIVKSSFELPTTFIEFETFITPPIVALQALADMFPSVRFRLLYKYNAEDSWTNMEVFPITPFGY